MHGLLISISLFVSFLSFLVAGKTSALQLQDAFGVSNYGFKCSEKIYEKHEIYAAAKKLCDARITRPHVIYEKAEDNGHLELWTRVFLSKFLDVSGGPFTLMPILRDGSLYPIDLPPASRISKNKAGEIVHIIAGPDRLVIDQECNVICALTDYDYLGFLGGRVELCQVLEAPEESTRSLESPREPSHRSFH
ncbi:hypothetical protein EPUL_004519, partial [Erysiphe pulchra]